MEFTCVEVIKKGQTPTKNNNNNTNNNVTLSKQLKLTILLSFKIDKNNHT